MTAVKPWLYMADDKRDKFYSVQYQVGEVMRIGALFAQPFLPAKATEILDILGVVECGRGCG